MPYQTKLMIQAPDAGLSWLVRLQFDHIGGRLTALLICLDVFVLTSFPLALETLFVACNDLYH